MKLNVIGLGRVFDHYQEILRNNEEINFGLLYDMDKKKRDQASKISQIAESYDDFIGNPSDLVCILTPSGTHYEIAKDLLEKKNNVLVEKPMALRASECKELKQIALDNNVRLYCGFQNRFNKAILEAKKAIDSKKIGKIISCHIALEWCRYQDYYNDEWHGSWKLDGGVIAQQAIHHIDAAIYLLGGVERVIGKGKNIENNLEAEDTFTGLMEFKNGIMSTLSASTSFRPKDKEARIMISGTRGSINIYGIAINKLTINSENGDETIEENFTTGYGLSHLPMIQAIKNSLKGSNRNYNELSIETAIHTTEVISSLYFSSEENKWGFCGKDTSSKWGL